MAFPDWLTKWWGRITEKLLNEWHWQNDSMTESKWLADYVANRLTEWMTDKMDDFMMITEWW